LSIIARAFTGVAILLVGLTIASATPAPFRVRILPTPEGCVAYALWHGLNDQGDATAQLLCDTPTSSGGIVWSHDSSVELSTLGGPGATPYALSPTGLAVGTAETPEMYDETDHVTRAVIWEDGVPSDLGTLGGPLGAAASINLRGLIVGACQPEETDPVLGRRPRRACAWTTGRIRDLGDLGGPEAYAYDVNSQGWIVGSSMTTGFEEHAFLLTGRVMRDLGTLGGPFSLAWALNDRGDVVGRSLTAEGPGQGLRPSHAFVWRRGAMLDLGTLGGPFATALDVNQAGDIVGWSRLTAPVGNSIDHAVLWRNDLPIDLNGLVDDSRGCTLRSATAINDRGQILANAWCDDGDHVVLLEPQ
jgi:probable HAF family extracellular repeat protein